ncbi:DUF973 family protein [Acidianus sp. RZ1]|uniref:DUF973 family protein n=1 Tax=Acidianus sp. RZ1 TaxID=1540082 RepID=UPI0014927C47|nr:DUF973 family protein [Acidianus sp. RZ1]NON61542.1 DUF973 family protein [Acidianus sp. RZ1]
MTLNKRSRRAIFDAIPQFVLVIASVVIALVVVGFVFGLLIPLSSSPLVTQVGVGKITQQNGEYCVTFTLKSTTRIQIISATLQGVTVNSAKISNGGILSEGITQVTIKFPNSVNLVKGNEYLLNIVFLNGYSIKVIVEYQEQ